MIDLEFAGRADRGSFRQRLADPRPLMAVELRPPRRELEGVHAMEAWIDVHHAVTGLSSRDTVIFLTDNAVGTSEEENLTHLVRNLGSSAALERIVPFLTLKHPLPYCESYAARARNSGFPALVVLGGDRHDGIARCLPHAWQLRERLRASQPALLLGGWANPYRDPVEQVAYLVDQSEGLDFILTQVLSHHDLAQVEAFLDEVARRNLRIPVFGGVFHYRSARQRTLRVLSDFIPVPTDGLVRDFRQKKLTADEVTATTLRALGELGMTRFYLCNLPTETASQRLSAITRLAGM